MSNREIRYRGKEYPIIERFRIGGRLYLAVARIGSAGRRAYQVFDPGSKQMRALHALPDSTATVDRVATLQRLTRGDNELLQIIEYRREHDQVWVVLPWIDGFNLRTVLTGIRERNRPRVAAPEAVRLMKGIAHALHHLHRRKQIVHGDIKPANLILTNRTSLVMIDYGNAWAIERTLNRGQGDGVSRAYSAPEVIEGNEHVDFRADIFSVGVVLYELLTSKIPYDGHGGNAGVLSAASRSGLTLVPASELSPERDLVSKRIWQPIDALLKRSLSISRDQRYDTSSEWVNAWTSAMTEIRDTRTRTPSKNWLTHLLGWSQK